MKTRFALLALSFAGVLAAACSSSSDGGATSSSSGGSTTPPGSSSGDPQTPPGTSTPVAAPETWADGKELSSVDIAAGVTVTIAPGAALTATAKTKITVHGTLVVKSDPSAHAKITGTGWTGIVVASGGTLTAEGLDVSGADIAVKVEGGGTATYDQGNIDGTPFGVATGGTLLTSHAKVTNPDNPTMIEGSFTATYLDYDEKDVHAIMADDASAVVSIEDSVFHSTGHLGPTAGPDLLTVNAAKSFHVAYTDISGAHCGFHFEGGDKIDIDHVTVKQISNGADLWGLGKTGKHTITASNFAPVLAVAFDETGSNGSVAISGCYTPGQNNLATPSAVTITSPAASAIADAHPR